MSMHRLSLMILAGVVVCCTVVAQGAVTIATVPVGNPGNAADGTGYGAVAYAYNIGKYEVTAGQYTEFLNAKANVSDTYGLYSFFMADPTNYYGCNIQRSGGGTVSNPYSYTVASDWANRPVNYVSFLRATRFTNWLHNGQGNGDTETGAYTLTSNGITNNTIVRNAGWKWAVASEDEWYKSAYYKGGSSNAGYFHYPTGDTVTAVTSGTTDGTAVFYASPVSPTAAADANNAGGLSAYGTMGQGGNVWEWNEAIINTSQRGLRGGSWAGYSGNLAASSRYYSADLQDGGFDTGFRVASVPEPSTLVMLVTGLLSLLAWAWRRHRQAA